MVPRNISFDPEVVTPAIAARDAILSDDESKAIRLWQREPMPFTAKSVTHEDFRQLHIVPSPPMQRQSYSPNPHRLDSRTTNGETYKAIPVERPPPPGRSRLRALAGMTTVVWSFGLQLGDVWRQGMGLEAFPQQRQ